MQPSNASSLPYFNIEAPQPLLPPGKYLPDEQKPSWTVKKFSLARYAPGSRKSVIKTREARRKHSSIPQQTTLAAIYEEPSATEKIPIKYITRIEDKRFKDKIIYESYKPKNLREMQDYINFVLKFRKILPNYCADESKVNEDSKGARENALSVDDILMSPEVSQEIKNYYNSEVQTKLPDFIDQEKILIFDSNFECGNLDRVSIVALNEYNLFLNVDTNTKGHSQWFYFAVTNTEKARTITFNILNCSKPIALFKAGMKPLVFSEIEYENSGAQWMYDTWNVYYAKNNIPRGGKSAPESEKPGAEAPQPPQRVPTFYTLSFAHTFKHSGDRVYFAFARPYAVTMEKLLLNRIQSSLRQEARKETLLEEDGLQKRIKQFVQDEEKTSTNEDGGNVQNNSTNMNNMAIYASQTQPGFSASPGTLQSSNVYSGSNIAIPKNAMSPTKKRKTQNILSPMILQKHKSMGNIALPTPETALLSECAPNLEIRESRFSWQKSQDFQLELEDFIYRKETLSHTLSGFPIEMLTITANNTKKHPLSKRKIIVITARVHAAESSGSYKMEGVIVFLTGKTEEAKTLREAYIFKIVPLLNPEGVICGNFRCSFTGTDLNRRWDQPDEILNSQIYYLKNLLRKLLAEKKEILVFCDLHGHSRKNNAFIYGCNKAANGGFCSWTKVRLLPRILAKMTHLFSYKDCKFRVESEKKRTARVVVWAEFLGVNSYTLESSFFGYTYGDNIVPYEVSDYFKLGESLLLALCEYYFVMRDLEKELVITHGWLKPSKFKELTGTPAADVLAKKMAEEKEELKRSARLSKIKNIIKVKKSQHGNNAAGNRTRKEAHGSGGNNPSKEPKRKKSSNCVIASQVPAKSASRNSMPPKKEKLGKVKKKISNTSQIEPLASINLPEISPRNFHLKEDMHPAQNTNHEQTEEVLNPTKTISSDHSDKADNRNNDNCLGPEERRETREKLKWREYFTQEEMATAYEQIKKGMDPNEEEAVGEESPGSDSNPSEDNMEQQDLDELIEAFPEDVAKNIRKQEIEHNVYEELPEPPADFKSKKTIILQAYSGSASPAPSKVLASSNFSSLSPQPKPEASPLTSKPWGLPLAICPSLIITSKNATQASTLIQQQPPLDDMFQAMSAYAQKNLPVKTRKSDTGRALMYESDGMQRGVPGGIIRRNNGLMKGKQRTISRNGTAKSGEGTMPTDKLPSLRSSASPVQHSRKISDLSPIAMHKIQEHLINSNASANMKLMPQPNYPNAMQAKNPPGDIHAAIIVNSNILAQCYMFGDQYQSYDHSPLQKQSVKKVTSVPPVSEVSMSPPPAKKPTKLPPARYEKETRLNYFRKKDFDKNGPTLSELLLEGFLPFNVRDCGPGMVLMPTGGNTSFRMDKAAGSQAIHHSHQSSSSRASAGTPKRSREKKEK